jgi:ketosteroid isomerase-like protein
MASEDVQVVTAIYGAFQAGSVEDALSRFARDAVIDATARIDGEVAHGPEGFRRVIGEWVAAFDDWHEEIEEIRDCGAGVCVIATQHGKAKDTGIDTRSRYAVVYEVADGAITRMTLFRDPETALVAAGASRNRD